MTTSPFVIRPSSFLRISSFWFRHFLNLFWVSAALYAQTPAEPLSPSPAQQSRVILLREDIEKIRSVNRSQEALRQKLKQPDLKLEERAKAEADAKALTSELETLKSKLSRDLSGVSEIAPSSETSEMNMENQFKEILKPALDSLDDLLKQPREIEDYRRRIEIRRKEIIVLDRAIEGLAKTISEIESEKEKSINKTLLDEAKRQRAEHEKNRTIFLSEITVLESRKSELEASRQGLGQYAAQLWSGYVLRRLLNILLAVAAFTGVLFFLRWVRKFGTRLQLRQRLAASPFVARASDVLYHVLTFITATFAAFVVLWISGDWLLLTLGMLLVAGLILVSRHTLPRMMEHARILLNLGGVREGERVIWRGLPWQVKRLSFTTDLVNPSLAGGHMQLPLREMGGMLSRSYGQKERWFPTEEGDWVELADGMVGKVVLQTPESVQLVPVGGSFRTYPTADFLAKNPRNLSHGFRVQSRFGLDYRHTETVLKEAPALLTEALRKALSVLVEPDNLKRVTVELAEAGVSSLDLAILADFAGGAAPHFAALHRLIQRTCVETAAAQGWTMPFRQVVVHRAGTAEDAAAVAAEEGTR